MTLRDITNQAMYLAVAGYINGEKFTKAQLYDLFSKMLYKNPSQYIFEVSMPDGRWYCKATRDWYGYDLYVPDNREQEAYIKAELSRTI